MLANKLVDGTRVIWKPQPGSQVLAMSCPAQVILFHGTRGPGKTDVQLMRFRSRVGLGYGRQWRGIIFDREYKNLDDLVSKSMRWFPEFHDGARFLSSKAEYKWTWPTGEELLFRAIKSVKDYWGYHGQEFPFIGWNELTKYPTDELFDMMMSCNRSSFLPEEHPFTIDGDEYKKNGRIVIVNEYSIKNAMTYTLPEMPLEVFATTNPYGSGHNWVRKRFIRVAKAGKIIKSTVNIFNPRTQQREDVVRTQTHIFGSYKENRYLNPIYIAGLEQIKDPNRRKAWLGGNWDIVAGGMFDDLWNPAIHLVKPFDIPPTWKIDRSFDYGESKPFSVGWWAESDGSDYIDHNGKSRSTVKGDLFRILEWYGTTGKTNQGLNLLPVKIAEGIVWREIQAKLYTRVRPGPSDDIWGPNAGNSIASQMLADVTINGQKYRGVSWLRANKKPGSRKQGWTKVRHYLANALPNYQQVSDNNKIQLPRTLPGLFAFDTCKYFVDLFPITPRDESDMDDVDTESEDHLPDEVRYRIYSGNVGAKSGTTKGM